MTVNFHQDLCKGCGACVNAFPDDAIRLIDGKAIDYLHLHRNKIQRWLIQ